VPVAIYAACGVPQMLAGRAILQTLGHWMTAEAYGEGLTLGATNWYQWVFEHNPEVFRDAGLLMTLIATAFFVLWFLDGPPPGLTERQWLVGMALLSVLFPPFFLTGMHERYFFTADVFAVIYAFYLPRGWLVTVLIQFASAFTYIPYLFKVEPVPGDLLPLPIMLAAGLVIRDLLGQGNSEASHLRKGMPDPLARPDGEK
jgi:Gpi18-like mannosyltransferase